MCNQTESLVKYYNILEVKTDAPMTEIKSSYLHLKRLYSSDSAVLSSVMDDISESEREELLAQIDAAYTKLKDYFSNKETEIKTTTRDRVLLQNIPEFEVYSGNALKLTREVLNVDLQDIALATGIPLKHLKNIEMERFHLLPPDGYIRIYVSRYADYLSLDKKRVVNEYMKAVNPKSIRA
jgi:Helix-turn-helix domain